MMAALDTKRVRELHRAFLDPLETDLRCLLRHERFRADHRLVEAGEARALVCRFPGPHNRLWMEGDEALPSLGPLLQAFRDWETDCWVEWSPAMEARDAARPGHAQRCLHALLETGFRPEGMRCLWVAPTAPAERINLDPTVVLRRCGPAEAEYWVEAMQAVEGEPAEEDEGGDLPEGFIPVEGEDYSIGRWVVEAEGRTAGTFQVFWSGKDIAALTGAAVHPSCRGQGLHHYMTWFRLREAHRAGKPWAVTVTEGLGASSRHLERCGFGLVANLLVLRMDWGAEDEWAGSQDGQFPG